MKLVRNCRSARLDPVAEAGEQLADPGQQPGRRVRDAVGQRLRPVRLHGVEAEVLGHEALHPLHAHLLGCGEGGDLLGRNRPERDEAHRRGVEVDADHPLRRQPADLRPDDRAGVAALHAERW